MFNSKKEVLTDIQKENVLALKKIKNKMLLKYLLAFVLYTTVIFFLITYGRIFLGISIGLLSTLAFAVYVTITGELNHRDVKFFLNNELKPDVLDEQSLEIESLKKIVTDVKLEGVFKENYIIKLMDGREIVALDFYPRIVSVQDNLSDEILKEKIKEDQYKKEMKQRSKKSKKKRKSKNQFNVNPTGNSSLLKKGEGIGYLNVQQLSYNYDVVLGKSTNKNYYGFPSEDVSYKLSFDKNGLF